MNIEVLISIIGGFLTLGISLNAFFLKSIINGQSKLEVDLAKIMVKIDNFNNRIDQLEHKVRKLELGAIECRSKCEIANTTV